MAGKNKDVWFIAALIIIAGVFAFLTFSRQKANTPLAKAVDELSDKIGSAVAVKSEVPAAALIKPDHPSKDVQTVAAVKTASVMVTPPHQVSAKNSYSIQVYSFKEKERAEAALKALKEKKYSAYIMVSDVGEKGVWYRVRVGTFSDEEEVKRVLQSVKKDFKSGIIVSE